MGKLFKSEAFHFPFGGLFVGNQAPEALHRDCCGAFLRGSFNRLGP